MPNPKGVDNFDFSLVGVGKAPFLGYDSAQDPTTVAPEYLIRGSQNVYRKNTGTVAVRPGRKLVGAINAAEDGVVASYEFQTSTGTTLPIWVLQSGKMQFSYQGTWYTLKTFDKTRFVFSPWWDDTNKVEDLIMVNGDDNLYRWNAGIGFYGSSALAAQASVVSATIGGGSIVGSYVVGDILTITGGDNTATVEITDVSGGGAPVALKLLTTGSGYDAQSYSTSAGSISGATGETVNVNRVEDTYTLTNNSGSTWASLGFNVSANNDGVLTGHNNAFVLNGTEYTYLGGTGTATLTNVFPTTSTDPVLTGTSGDIVYQQIVTVPATPLAGGKNDFIVTLNNQLIVGSYTSKVIYISADTDFSDFTNNGDLVTGDPDFAILDEFPTGMVIKGESVYIFAGNANDYVITPNTPVPFAVSIGGSYTLVITKVEKQVGSGNSAALAHEFITTVGEDILYLSQDHQLRSLGTIRNIVTQKTPSLSKAVRQELMDEDFTGGALRMIDEFAYITAPISGKTYLYQIRDAVDDVGNLTAQRLWHPLQTWDISRLAIVDGIVHGYSSEFPQAYLLWDTNQWHDDTPTGPESYISRARFAYRQFNQRDDLGSFDKVYYEGYILEHSDLVANIYNDYQGATAVQTKVLSSTDVTPALYGGEGITLIGGTKIGAKTLGGGVPDTNYSNPFPKFRVIGNFSQEDCFEFSLELVSQLADSYWEILALGPDMSTSLNKPVNLQI